MGLAEIVVVSRVIVMFLMFWAGLKQIQAGLEIYRNDKKDNHSGTVFEVAGFRVATKSRGALVVATAFLWGLFAVKIAPNYRDRKVEVYSLKTDNATVEAPKLVGYVRAQDVTGVIRDSDSLQKVFRESLRNASAGEFRINGDLASTVVNKSSVSFANGNAYTYIEVRSNRNSALLKYMVLLGGQGVEFVPEEALPLSPSNQSLQRTPPR